MEKIQILNKLQKLEIRFSKIENYLNSLKVGSNKYYKALKISNKINLKWLNLQNLYEIKFKTLDK